MARRRSTTPADDEKGAAPLLRGTSRSSIARFLRAGGQLPAEVVPSKGHPVGRRRTLLSNPRPVKRRPKAMTKAERARRDRERRAASRVPSYTEWLAGRPDHPTLRQMYRARPDWSADRWTEHLKQYVPTNPTKEKR
ncbi:MAG TPA: hypothetical protein PKE29_15500 [Phycisphaerales bacterium]|nr:hypothetical protein [Phycisphaerales bacterium]